MKKINLFIVAAWTFLSFGLADSAVAQSYPSSTIKLVSPFAAGSPTDALARVVANHLGKRFNQPVIVDNKPGATGMLGTDFVAKSTPDGYTILFGTNTTQVANQFFFKNMPYDGERDFIPIAVVGGVPHALVVTSFLPVSSVDELIKYAKLHPGKLSFPYANSSTRIMGSTFRAMTKTEILEVPYKAYGQAVTELLGGQTQMMFIDFTTGLPHINSGKLKPLAITPERSDKLPGVPAMKESLPKFEIGNWVGFFAPTGTPKEIVERFGREVNAVLAMPEVQREIDGIGFVRIKKMSPVEFAKFIANERVHWGNLIKITGIEPE